VWAMAEELGVEIHVAHQIEWAFSGREQTGVGGKKKRDNVLFKR
jgi:hypothetical protein